MALTRRGVAEQHVDPPGIEHADRRDAVPIAELIRRAGFPATVTPAGTSRVTTEPAPLNSMAMAWNWQFGRKFVKIELTQDDSPDWAAEIFYLHVGSTDCTGDPGAGEKAKCALPNRDKITLKKFNPASQRIAIDLKSLFAGVDIASNVGTPGCMSETTDPECPSVFKSLGLKLGTKQTTNQTAFRVVRK